MSAFAQTDNNNVFSKLRKEAFNNTLKYYDKSSPTTTAIKAFYIYIVKTGSELPYLMVRFQYSGSSKIGVNAYKVIADKHNIYTVTPPSGYIFRNGGNNYDDFRSQCDLKVGESFLNFLRELIKSENPKLEYLGTYDNVTTKLTINEINAISNVLDAYDALLVK
jgi:hypothetical protein